MLKYPRVVAIVDDNACTLKAFARLLSVCGYRVQLFESAEQYLESAHASKASCAVIDIDLGCGMSGLDLAKKISSSGRAIPIIFMTGGQDPAIRQQAMDVGCVAFLEKPFAGDQLLDAIVKSEGSRSVAP